MHLEEKAAQIVDLFARLGGGWCWSTLSTPVATGLRLLYVTYVYHHVTTDTYDVTLSMLYAHVPTPIRGT